MRISWRIKRLAMACMAVAMLGMHSTASAEEAAKDVIAELEQTLNSPEVPPKASKCIISHMTQIEEWLERHGLKTSMQRNNEVIHIQIPISEMFIPNTTELSSIGKEKLVLIKDVVKYGTMYKIVAAVHSDDTGDAVYRQMLTDGRADAIRLYLASINEGSTLNVEIFGMSNAQPLGDNVTMESRDNNRRVSIYIVPERQMIESSKSGKLCK